MGMMQTFHVASGSFEAGSTQSRILQAYLGTCVGVAIADEQAGVGGLIHLLLPEAFGVLSLDSPEKYASTGMPLFIRQLVELGARPGKMQAVVAGGALVGPVTTQDMNLDIGGRTVEKVLESLQTEGIAVTRSETGGFFTCSLSLDMKNWNCTIQPAGFDVADSQTEAPTPSQADIKQAIENVRPIPQVALKVMRIIQEGSYDIGKIAEEVRKDQVISARTIYLCNSAMFTKSHDVASLDHALVYLGQELFLKLVISAAVESYYSQNGSGYSLCKGGLYHHAIGTAMVAERIATMTEKAAPAVAYTAGLLHDIGKVVLDQYMAGAYPLFYREFQNRKSDIIGAENRVLGMDHTHIGELLAQKWSLPALLTEPIRFHHQPEKSVHHRALTTIVYLADLLMSRFHVGLELERMGTANLSEHLEQLGLSSDQFGELVNLVPRNISESLAETENGQDETNQR